MLSGELFFCVTTESLFYLHYLPSSVYRSTNFEEAQIYYIRLKDKLPVFSRYFPNFSLSQLSEMCKHINQHPTQVMI